MKGQYHTLTPSSEHRPFVAVLEHVQEDDDYEEMDEDKKRTPTMGREDIEGELVAPLSSEITFKVFQIS